MFLSNMIERLMKRNNLEFTEQCAFFEWLNYYPSIRGVTFAIPNGGSRNLLEAVNLKRSGVTKGVPDTVMCIPNKTACGLFIEFKTGKNQLTKEQAAMMHMLRNNGYECHVCCSLNEAREVVTKYLASSKIHFPYQPIVEDLCHKN